MQVSTAQLSFMPHHALHLLAGSSKGTLNRPRRRSGMSLSSCGASGTGDPWPFLCIFTRASGYMQARVVSENPGMCKVAHGALQRHAKRSNYGPSALPCLLPLPGLLVLPRFLSFSAF